MGGWSLESTAGIIICRVVFWWKGSGGVSLLVMGVRGKGGGWAGSLIGKHFADTSFLFLLVALYY